MESWFSDASVARLPAEFSWVGLGFTAPTAEEGVPAHTGVIPMTACLKKVACCHTKQVSEGGCNSSGVWRTLHSLALMLWIKVPVLPARNEITLTGERLSEFISSHVFTASVVCLVGPHLVEATKRFVFLTNYSEISNKKRRFEKRSTQS